MKSFSCSFIVLVILGYTSAQDLFNLGQTEFEGPGKNCRVIRTNIAGKCVKSVECGSDLKPRPSVVDICDPDPVTTPRPVWKPDPNDKRRISERKCDEWKKVFDRQYVLSLSARPGTNIIHHIIGGIPAEPNEFPHMALIGWDKSSSGQRWQCGGTLISEKYVLTAAHCTFDQGNKPTAVRVSAHDLSSDNESKFEDYGIARIIKHPDHKTPQIYNDIAILELNATVKLKPFLFPACLWTKPEIPMAKAWASGWGRTSFGGSGSQVLQKVELSFIPNLECNSTFAPNRKMPKGIIETQMCLGDRAGGKDTCQGDSGGPVQTKFTYTDNEGATFTMFDVLGVTSFGLFCGSAEPSVYTRVSSYLSWIESVVWPDNK